MSLVSSQTPFIRLVSSLPDRLPRTAQRVAFLSKDPEERGNTKSRKLDPDTDVPCFTAGTRIRTAAQDIPIEHLQVGDTVLTRDRGPQPIRWIGTTEITPTLATAPVAFAPGTLGNTETLLVSPCHRMLLSGWRCSKIAGAPEALAAAVHLVNGRDVTRVADQPVRYFHLAFDQHEIIMANGVPSESFHPDTMPLAALGGGPRAELLAIFPHVAERAASFGPLARPEVKPYEARLIRP